MHDISIALGVDPGSDELDGLRYDKVCILADADSDGRTSRRCCARCSCGTSGRWSRPATCSSRCRRSIAIDVGKEVFYALDEAERGVILDRIEAEKKRREVTFSASRASAR